MDPCAPHAARAVEAQIIYFPKNGIKIRLFVVTPLGIAKRIHTINNKQAL
jgi:hypothetical protein